MKWLHANDRHGCEWLKADNGTSSARSPNDARCRRHRFRLDAKPGMEWTPCSDWRDESGWECAFSCDSPEYDVNDTATGLPDIPWLPSQIRRFGLIWRRVDEEIYPAARGTSDAGAGMGCSKRRPDASDAAEMDKTAVQLRYDGNDRRQFWTFIRNNRHESGTRPLPDSP